MGNSASTDLSHGFDSFHELSHTDLDGNLVNFEAYRGKVVLAVNVASKCGKTRSHYEQLEALYSKYKDSGLEILGFPCRQFLSQEHGTSAAIKEAACGKFGATFPIFSLLDVNGPDTHDIFKYLRSAPLTNQNAEKNEIEWNFTKFIVNREGQVVKRYGPKVDPSLLDTEERMQAWLGDDFSSAMTPRDAPCTAEEED